MKKKKLCGDISSSDGDEYEDVYWDFAPCSVVEIYRLQYLLPPSSDSNNPEHSHHNIA
jgi:hypothetical protein